MYVVLKSVLLDLPGAAVYCVYCVDCRVTGCCFHGGKEPTESLARTPTQQMFVLMRVGKLKNQSHTN